MGRTLSTFFMKQWGVSMTIDEQPFDPLWPLQDEIRLVRSLLGSGGGGNDNPAIELGRCLRFIVNEYRLDARRDRAEPPTLLDILDTLEGLSTTPPAADVLANAPLLEDWSPGSGVDGCARLYGSVTGHPRLRDGARIFTSPYLRLDCKNGWARSWSRFYRLGTYNRSFMGELILDEVLDPHTRSIEIPTR